MSVPIDFDKIIENLKIGLVRSTSSYVDLNICEVLLKARFSVAENGLTNLDAAVISHI